MRDVAGLAIDAQALSQLRQRASRDPQQAMRAAASEFEALFMQQMLRSMREAIPRSGLMDGPGQATYEQMLDAELAQSVSGMRGGLADVIVRQLGPYLPGGTTGTADPGESARPASDGSETGPDAGRSVGVLPSARTGAGESAAVALPRISTPRGLPGVISAALGGRSSPASAGTVAPAVRAPAVGATAPGADGQPVARPASSREAEFVGRMYPHAEAAERATGVPAEFIVGQAALESGWGRAEMRHPDGRPAHNLFGVKAGAGWKGATVASLTTEYVDGEPRKSVEKFRAYGSYAEAFVDWARLMTRNSRYAEVLKTGASAAAFAGSLQRAGYATDPQYANKLERTIERAVELQAQQG